MIGKFLLTVITLYGSLYVLAQQPKNIILMIGDGMGLTQLSSAYYYGDTIPNFSRFRYIGLINTSSASDTITDSAAGATAFASGIKTYNGAIGVDTDTNDVPTILELIEPKGVKTGLIATSTITHATPACFYAHVASRGQAEDIAQSLAASEVDFFAGGGWQYFLNRGDGRNLIDEMKKRGLDVDTGSLNRQIIQENNRVGYLMSKYGLPSMLNGRGNFLTEATILGTEFLSSRSSAGDKGFFLMVEGSQIDWAGHDADAASLIAEVLDFDQAIGAALDFAEKDGQTLVIVTADHETGGFALGPAFRDSTWDYNSIAPSFYENANRLPGEAGHTTSLIPVFAFGPGAENFIGIYQNTDIFHRMMRSAGWHSD